MADFRSHNKGCTDKAPPRVLLCCFRHWRASPSPYALRLMEGLGLSNLQQEPRASLPKCLQIERRVRSRYGVTRAQDQTFNFRVQITRFLAKKHCDLLRQQSLGVWGCFIFQASTTWRSSACCIALQCQSRPAILKKLQEPTAHAGEASG